MSTCGSISEGSVGARRVDRGDRGWSDPLSGDEASTDGLGHFDEPEEGKHGDDEPPNSKSCLTYIVQTH